MMKIPFVDLKRQYSALKTDINRRMRAVIDSCEFILGENCHRFEEEFARFCGSKYAIGVSSGSEALLLALKTLGIGQGDEVITTPLTFVATADTILRSGARPVFADIDPVTRVMAPEKVRKAITKRTRAIIPVHLYGYFSDMAPLNKIAGEHGLFIIEDACQAHGAIHNGKRSGSAGDVGCFSFYPSKNLGSFGDSGAIVTDNKKIYDTISTLRDYGQRGKYLHALVGYNARMDELQAVVLRAGLKKLDKWNKRRVKAAREYNAGLGGIKGITLPRIEEPARHVFHLYVIGAKNRTRLRSHLLSRGIQTGLHYPYPLHLQKAYSFLGYKKGDFPEAELAARSVISLPIFPDISAEEIAYVANAVRGFYENPRRGRKQTKAVKS